MGPRLVLYFDVMSPYSYLAVERVAAGVGAPVSFQPVLLGGLWRHNGRGSWATGDPARREAGMMEVESRAQWYGLPAVRWPRPWPTSSLLVMRVATWALAQGAGEAFAVAAGRHAFVDGADLSQPEETAAAARAAGIDGDAALEAARDPAVKAELRAATDAAHARGVFGVPTLAFGERLLWGDDRLEEAASLAGAVA